jgi:hypothetical protein
LITKFALIRSLLIKKAQEELFFEKKISFCAVRQLKQKVDGKDMRRWLCDDDDNNNDGGM